MRILHIAHKTPFPISDGGCFAMMQLVKSLHHEATVDALIFDTHKHPFTPATKAELSNYCSVIYPLKVATEIKPIAAIVALLRNKSYNLSRFCSTELKSFLEQNQAKYDAIICDGVYSAAQYSSIDNGNTKLIIRAHNVEHQIWEQQARLGKSLLKRFYLKRLARTLRNEELALLSKADAVWTISEADETVLANQIKTQITTIPISINTPSHEVDYAVNQCFHIGSMNWKPNKDAVDFLIQAVWNRNADLPPLVIGGSFITANSFTNLPSNCSVIGSVNDALAFMAKNGILVSPIQSGSGVRVKLLEALSLGVPIITTAIGASGIDVATAGIIIAETAEEFTQAIVGIANDEQRKIAIGAKGKAYINSQHQFEAITLKISKALGK
jgi:glycosyltransferase involved in cell wall biosynthesis